MNAPRRFLAYGLAGWCAEVLCTGIHDFIRERDPRLPARSSLWMFPIYGLAQPLFEPLHRRFVAEGTPARGRVPASTGPQGDGVTASSSNWLRMGGRFSANRSPSRWSPAPSRSR